LSAARRSEYKPDIDRTGEKANFHFLNAHAEEIFTTTPASAIIFLGI
jgi:hypothetical protein